MLFCGGGWGGVRVKFQFGAVSLWKGPLEVHRTLTKAFIFNFLLYDPVLGGLGLCVMLQGLLFTPLGNTSVFAHWALKPDFANPGLGVFAW